MTVFSELRVICLAQPKSAAPLRHTLAAFLSILDVDEAIREDILTAVGEALANAVEHAYDNGIPPGDVELVAKIESDDILAVNVSDHGIFVERDLRPGRGFGLRIVRAIAREVVVETDGGTHIRMTFDAGRVGATLT